MYQSNTTALPASRFSAAGALVVVTVVIVMTGTACTPRTPVQAPSAPARAEAPPTPRTAPPLTASLPELDSASSWIDPPIIAVRARVNARRDHLGVKRALDSRSRAVLEAHADVTTNLERGRALGIPVVTLDASASCSFRTAPRHVELACTLRFAVSDDRGRMLSTWRRSVGLSGALDDAPAELLAHALDHAVRELPERLLTSIRRSRVVMLAPRK